MDTAVRKSGAPGGFSGRFEDANFSLGDKDEDLIQPPFKKKQDFKNLIFMHGEK